MSLTKRWLKTMRFDINLVQKRKKNTTLALGKKHYLHCFGLLTCFSVCVSLWLSGICPLSLCCFPFYFYFSSHAFLLMSIQRLKLAHVLAWFGLKDSVECVCCCCKQPFPGLSLVTCFFIAMLVIGFFSSGNINYVCLFCFSSVTIALCLFYSPSVTIFLSILALLLQSQFV